MRTNLKKLFAAGFFSLLLAVVWLLSRAPVRQQTTALSPFRTVAETAAEPIVEQSRPRRLSKRQQPTPQPMAAPVPEPPDDPDEVREWARQNAEASLAWMMNAPAGEKRDAVAEIACAQIAQSNPADAVSLAERYSGGSSNLLENLVQQWADQNEPAATAYAVSKPSGEERDRLLSRVAFTRSKENPAEAAKLVAEWISPGQVQNEAAISVLHQWALRDGNAALAWAQLFPEDSLRDRALKEVWNIFSPPQE
jgi:hypothetical protein